jgi:class 3 adenylate cyclase
VGALVVRSAAAYVPRMVAQRYASGPAPQPPCCAPLRAVLLFADVCGFSALTRWMAQRYEQGALVTSQALNSLFGAMTACVHAHGGDVVKFAGDALIVAWPLAADAGALDDGAAAAAAAACATALLQLPSGATAGVPALSLHIALHCGQLAEMHLGDGDAPGGRWEHLLCGAPLRELAPLISAAAAGECVASHALWALLPPGIAERGEVCAGGARLVAVNAADDEALQFSLSDINAEDAAPSPAVAAMLSAYLPPALGDTLAHGEQRWLAELRRVSVVFILLPPCGATDFALAAALVAEVHAVTGRHGGTPQQSICDDKGSVSIAVFGKPPLSHADDVRRALAAACELAASLGVIAAAHGRTEPVAVGVTTGRAFCGNVGAASRCEFAVVGEVMNSAAALMGQAARAGLPLLCDAETARAQRAAAAEEGAQPPSWLDAPPLLIVLKGADAPQPAYAVPVAVANVANLAEPCVSPRRRVALLGRDAELARAAAAVGGGGGKDGAVVLVCGGMSSGKSLFLRAAAAEAEHRGVAVLELAASRSDGAGSEGAAWRTPWLAAAAARHVEQLPPALRPLAPLLAKLLPDAAVMPQLATPDSAEALAALSESAAEDALAQLTAAVLRPALAGGALLVADDASALDALSAALLAAVHAALRPALLLSLPRSELEDPASGGAELVAQLRAAAPACRAVTLGPLPPSAAAALCAAELRCATPEQLPAGLVPALQRLAGGHPLLLRESLALLLRQGHLRAEGPGEGVSLACDLAALPELVARGLTDQDGAARMEVLMQRRLDGLSPEARAVTRAAAVLGPGPFELPLLARCAADAQGASLAVLWAAAAELVHEGMWVHAPAACDGDADDDAGGAVRYVFAHEMLRALVLAATPEDARAQLFNAVLSRLEEAPQSDGDAASAWADRARLARGGNQHVKAAACFLAAAQASIAAAPARGLADAARAAQEGLACMRAAAAAAAERAAAERRPAPRSSSLMLSSSPSASSLSSHDGGLMMSHRSSYSGSAGRISAAFGYGTSPQGDELAAGPSRRRSGGEGDTAVEAQQLRSSLAGDPEAAQIHCDLQAVLDTVARVQASGTLLLADLQAHAAVMSGALVAEAPEVLTAVRSKNGRALTDPSMVPVLVAHQATLLRLVGSAVSGTRDWDGELAPTLLRCGRMHARFSDTIREFYPPCGRAMMSTLRGALGEACTPEVAAAWEAAFAFVATHMVAGIDAAQQAMAAEETLTEALSGDEAPGKLITAAAAVIAVTA